MCVKHQRWASVRIQSEMSAWINP